MTDEQKAAEAERLRFEGDLDKWMKVLGAGISGYQPEAYAVMDAACQELVKLRSDALSARLADAVQPAAGEGGLREALERIAELNPNKANAHSAWDMHCTVKAIAKTALSTSAPAGVVGIKPLEWEETLVDRGDGSSDVDGWEAETAFGACYGIEIDFGTDSYLFWLTLDGILIDCFEDENAAKGFAHTHFAARIRACLITPPAQEPPR